MESFLFQNGRAKKLTTEKDTRIECDKCMGKSIQRHISYYKKKLECQMSDVTNHSNEIFS